MFNKEAVIIKDIAPLKEKPEKNSQCADEVLMGMMVEVLENLGEWLYVKTHDNYTGYMNREHLEIDKQGQWKVCRKYFIIAAFADIQSQPGYTANTIMTIPRGAQIGLTGKSEDKWLEVVLPSEEQGWIREEVLLKHNTEKGNILRQAIVDTALLYKGTPYRKGGKSPMGIDCTGLSSMTYILNGINIPRAAEDQMKFMKRIERRQSKPGDLLFFQDHVAIYIGEDKFVHATGRDAFVKINSLNKDSSLYRKDLDEKYICTGTVF
jgi:beta-lactamase class A